MKSFKGSLLSTTFVPMVVVVAGVGATSAVVSGGGLLPEARAACAPANPCNPCAAKNPCNPCAAAACNPCNPCAAKNPCNPCAAAACNPCNPCAAKNPCNPCAAAACNPCNPCAAKNPCNPCAAAACNPCNPCGPCGAGAIAVDLTGAEATAAYDCILNQMQAAYAKSGDPIAKAYAGWRRYSRTAYQSDTHGGRFMQNYANAVGRAYGAFENSGPMPAGAQLAKDSFTVNAKGQVGVGPLFTMEKMPAGFNAESADWRYSMIMPNGAVFGTTNGRNAAGVQFCVNCHGAVSEDQDSMFFLPDELRVN